MWDKYTPPFKFAGRIYCVTVEVDGEMITDPEAEIKKVLARQ